MATTTRRATEADLWEQSARGQRCELVDGQVRVMSPAGFNPGRIAVRIVAKLLTHAGSGGFVVDSSTGFRLPNGNVRVPDAAYVQRGRVDERHEGFCPVAPDLAVEVVSPTDTPREVLEKVGEYLGAGTRLVWVVDPGARAVSVYRSLSEVVTLREDGFLDGGDVLPGFRCPLSDLF